jgi:hypothetical protein
LELEAYLIAVLALQDMDKVIFYAVIPIIKGALLVALEVVLVQLARLLNVTVLKLTHQLRTYKLPLSH